MISIIQAGVPDLAILQKLGKETFIEAFAASNTEANLQAYLESSFTDEKITTELTNPESLFFIAWENDSPIGYLKINTGHAQTEPEGDAALEIERIYVLSAYHGKKIGQLLFEKAVEMAQQLNKSNIWLGVWEHNPRAVRFYEKNGFIPFGKHIFTVGDDDQTDVLMRKQTPTP